MLLSTAATVVARRPKAGRDGRMLPERVVTVRSDGDEPALMLRAVIGQAAAEAFAPGVLVRVTIEVAEQGMQLYRSEP